MLKSIGGRKIIEENNNFREVFSKILLETVISEKLDINKKNNLIKPLNEYIKQKIPKTLFRYRSFDNNGNNLNALKNNRLYFNTPNNFNDPHDCLIYINHEEVKQEIRKINQKEILKFIKENKDTKEYKNLFGRKERRYIDNKKMEFKFFKKIQDKFYLEIKKQMYFLSDYYKSTPKIACLTENKNSSQMWGYYANSHEGFVIEYETKGLNLYKVDEEIVLNCYPIIYSDSRFDATDSAVSFAKKKLFESYLKKLKYSNNPVILKDDLLFIKANIFKHTDWSHEKEWRVWLNSTNSNLNFINIKPKAIYLGCRISNENRTKILEIAKLIECKEIYQMLREDNSPFYKMNYEKVNELN